MSKKRLFLASVFWLWGVGVNAAVTSISSPGSFNTPSTIITFDGYSNGTFANTLYSGLGVTFYRDDGQVVNIYDWSSTFRTTVSPPDVLATVSLLGASTYVSHLNVSFASPVYQVGAFFGNDAGNPDFTSITLSAYDAGGALLGQVSEAANGNESVDQFIGLQSDQPISRVRFQNYASSGAISTLYSVVIDNFQFSSVPEPSSVALIAFGLANLGWASRRASRKCRTAMGTPKTLPVPAPRVRPP